MIKKITIINIKKRQFFVPNNYVLFFVFFLLLSSKLFSQTSVNSLAELQTYLDVDNANIKLTPGTYSITANDVAIGCENGYSLGSGDVVNCSAGCTYGPVYVSTYESDRRFNADNTILPESNYYYRSGSVAYIGGSQHNVTFRCTDEALNMGLKIKIEGGKNNIRLLYGNLPHQNDFVATNFVINNLTNYPVFLSDKSTYVTG